MCRQRSSATKVNAGDITYLRDYLLEPTSSVLPRLNKTNNKHTEPTHAVEIKEESGMDVEIKQETENKTG